MSASIATTSTEPAAIATFMARLRTASPFWWRAGWIGLGIAMLFAFMGQIDPRLINGVGVWDKPGKFMFSFAAHVWTFAWAFALMPEGERQARLTRYLSVAFVTIFALEVVYMSFRAARGEASHFNTGTPIAATLYALMGLGAMSLTAITAWFGWRLLRTRNDLPGRAAAIGLMLGALLGTLAGLYMSRQTGHWVGGAANDAGGLPLFHWSTTGGDLRVAHFTGLHAMQAVPLAAWLWPRQRTIWIAALAITFVTLAVFLQAVNGQPLLRV